MRQFVLAQLANFASVVGGSITFIALPWLSFVITKSSTASALVIAATSIPVILLSPFMGSIIDRFGRRRSAMWFELGQGASAAAVAVFNGLWGIGIVSLIVLSVIKNAFGPGSQTARKALVPDVAEKAGISLDRANSVHESVFAAGFAVGPAIAAFLISSIDVYAAFWAAGIAGFVSVGAMALIRVTERQEHDPNEEKGNVFVFAMQGIKTLGRIKVLGLVFAGFLMLSVIYIPTEMVVLPRYFNEINDAKGLGLLITTMAGMSMVTSLGFEWLHKRVGYANILRIAIGGVSIVMVPMSLLPPQWAMIALGAALGGVWGPIAPLLNTVIQKLVAANLRGRVFALEMMMWNVAPLTSFIVVGLCLDSFGVRPVYLTLALIMVGAAALLLTSPRLKDLKAIEA
ncbi:MAG: MFS transporter [Rhodoluna sp.]|nr:MFS transporter [Rhodoluna sp.]